MNSVQTQYGTVKDRRLASGTTPPRFVVRPEEQRGQYINDGGPVRFVEYIAREVGTGRILGRSTQGPHTAATFVEMRYPGASEMTEAEAAALAEPRIAFAPRPTQTPLRYYLADVIVCGTERLVCKAAREFHADTMLVEGANAAHVLMLMGEHYPGAIRMAPNAAGEWGAA